jgi:hypothetical protein
MDANTTAQQNQAVGLSNISTAIAYAIGQFTSNAYVGEDTAVQIYTGRGRLTSVTILEGTSSSGVKFYNSASASSLPDNGLVYVVPPDSKIGVVDVGLQFTSGLVVYIGFGVTINVTYSAG